MQELRYAMRNNVLISVDDDEVVSGLNCKCTCPHCNAALVAKKGAKRKHHFAHYSVTDCNHGAETALHIMAKNIIAETKSVWVPYAPKCIYDQGNQGKVVHFDRASIEKQLSPQIRSDVLLELSDRRLNVEIKVTHEVYEAKQINLFNEGIATIEIDLSGHIEDYSEDIIRKYLSDGSHTKLIYSEKSKEIFAKWILGDWANVHDGRYGKYIDNCPLNGGKAYFFDMYNRGGRDQCHECYGFEDYNDGPRFLCRSAYGNLDFSKVEKIIEVKKVEGRLQYAELIVGGEKRVIGKK